MKTNILFFLTVAFIISAAKPPVKATNESPYFELVEGLDKIVNDYINSGKVNDQLIDENNKLRMQLINKVGYEKFQKELETSLQTYLYIEWPTASCTNSYPCVADAYFEYYGGIINLNKLLREAERCNRRYCHDPNGDADGDGERDGPLPSGN